MTNDPEAIVRALFLTPEGRATPTRTTTRCARPRPSIAAAPRAPGSSPATTTAGPRCAIRASARTTRSRWSGASARLAAHPVARHRERSMINVHGPDHTRLRRLVVKAFTPAHGRARSGPRIERMVDDAARAARRGGRRRRPRDASPSRCRSP